MKQDWRVGLIQGGYSARLPHIKCGTLVEALPNLRPKSLNASFVVAYRRNLSQRVRAFRNWTENMLKPYFDKYLSELGNLKT